MDRVQCIKVLVCDGNGSWDKRTNIRALLLSLLKRRIGGEGSSDFSPEEMLALPVAQRYQKVSFGVYNRLDHTRHLRTNIRALLVSLLKRRIGGESGDGIVGGESSAEEMLALPAAQRYHRVSFRGGLLKRRYG